MTGTKIRNLVDEMMNVEIESTLPALDVQRESLRSAVRRVLRGEGRDQAAVNVVLVDDPYIRRLNHRYRNLQRTTDVLSFSLSDEFESDRDILGDVYISVDRARDQAHRFRVSLDDELQRLVIHGCLHLMGYDHHTQAERNLMRQKESIYSDMKGFDETPMVHLGEPTRG